MSISRRSVLALPFLAGIARAQSPVVPPPVLFLHGNGDHAALWQTTLWRFESNGWPREHLRAVNFPDPLARDDDAVPQPMRSSSTEQTERLAEFVRTLRAETGAARIALAGNSRGGNPIRDFTVQQGGASQISHAVLCGTPNRGVMDWPERAGNEFNSRGPFLSRLNAGPSDVVAETAFLTLRSDGNDLYAQPRAIWSPTPDRPTGTDVDGPGASRRHQPRPPRARPPRGCLSRPRLRRDGPLHRRPRPRPHRRPARGAAGARRSRHRHPRRGADQPPGRGRRRRGLPHRSRDRRPDGRGRPPPHHRRRRALGGR
jgi:hypothetical protein